MLLRTSYWGNSINTNALEMSPWPGVTGITNVGWYWRVIAADYNINGAPSSFRIGNNQQMAKGSFVVLAIAYPAATTFTVYMTLWGNSLPNIPMAASLNDVISLTESPLPPSDMTCTGLWDYNCQITGDKTGFSWYFDGTYLYLRIVPFAVYNKNTRFNADKSFDVYGARVHNIFSGMQLRVNTQCINCAIQIQDL